MRRIWVTVLVSGLIASVLTTAAVLAPSTQDTPPAADAIVTTRGGAELAERGDDDGGLGPPPWAQASGRLGARRGKTDKSWKDDWRALTPAQKARKMEVLSRAHDQGMLEWTRCVRSAGTDGAKRRDCEKPLPPGLAKKQS